MDPKQAQQVNRIQPARRVSHVFDVAMDHVYGWRNRLEEHLMLWLATHHDGADNITSGGLPIPPRSLRKWVAGTENIEWFLEGGKRAAATLATTLQYCGIDLETKHSILDFGCGCGRVMRHLRHLERIWLHGTDINHTAIAWCDEHLPFAEFSTNQLLPPLRYHHGVFDLIYCFSVFTHLPEEIQLAWMRELRRVTAPGGHLIVSLHGDAYLSRLDAGQSAAYQAGKLVMIHSEQAGMNTCAAYHPQAYVRTVLAGLTGWDVLACFPEGALGNPSQDVYLLGAA